MNRVGLLRKTTKVIIIAISLMIILSVGLVTYWANFNNAALQALVSRVSGDTETEIVVEETIPFDRENIDDDNLASGQSEIRQEGLDGIKKITFRVTKDKDGNEINRERIKEEVLKDPITEITAIGTKDESQNMPGQDITYNGNLTYSGATYPSYDGPSNTSSSNAANHDSPTNNANNAASGSGVYYCTSQYQLENISSSGVHIKTNVPCAGLANVSANWSAYTIEVSAATFYSYGACSVGFGPSELILEARCSK